MTKTSNRVARASKSPDSGKSARVDPPEALIPDQLRHYLDRYDGRWRGDQPYLGLGNAVRAEIQTRLSTSVRWMLPGDLLDGIGIRRWADAHFPGYDPNLGYCGYGIYEEAFGAIWSLATQGFLNSCNQEYFIRTDKPPETAYSVFGNAEVHHQLKRIANDREVLRGDIAVEVINTAYAEGPTLEQWRFLDGLEHWDKKDLTDADFMNPSPELLAKVAARKEHYRLLREKTAVERAETERRHALIKRHKEAWETNKVLAPELQKLLANTGLNLKTYIGQQRRENETHVDALVRVLDSIQTQQEESVPRE